MNFIVFVSNERDREQGLGDWHRDWIANDKVVLIRIEWEDDVEVICGSAIRISKFFEKQKLMVSLIPGEPWHFVYFIGIFYFAIAIQFLSSDFNCWTSPYSLQPLSAVASAPPQLHNVQFTFFIHFSLVHRRWSSSASFEYKSNNSFQMTLTSFMVLLTAWRRTLCTRRENENNSKNHEKKNLIVFLISSLCM